MPGKSRLCACYMSAAVAAIGLVVVTPDAVHAATTPVLSYSFPGSWNGMGTVVTDLSPAGTNGIVSTTTAKKPSLSTTLLPAGAAPGSASANTSAGGFETNAKEQLTTTAVAAAGGFSYTAEFMWNGTDLTSNNHVEKIIDFAGTESLHVDTSITGGAPGTATLGFLFSAQGVAPAPDINTGPTLVINANTWYNVIATFDTQGNVVSPVDGSIAGLATLRVTPVGGATTTASLLNTMTTYGDGTALGARNIGIGELGLPSTTSTYVPFQGNIYSASVSLGVVPEPASLSLVGLGAAAVLARRRRA